MQPYNLALVRPVAQMIRLCIACIDFITPDISRSWLEASGPKCQINAQPQFGFTRREARNSAISCLLQSNFRILVVLMLLDTDWGS